jgi:leader peptidase (prepilin peptidase)/N-methyltransferase
VAATGEASSWIVQLTLAARRDAVWPSLAAPSCAPRTGCAAPWGGSTVSLPVVLLVAAAAATAAFALTSWMQALAEVQSRWLTSWVHVPLAGLAGAGAASLATTWAQVVAFTPLAVAAALLLVIDLADHRLPDAIVKPMYPVLFAGLALAAAVDGGWADLGRAAAAGAVLLAAYFVLALVSPSGLGLGDVKLAGLLGGFLGWFGWSHVLLGTVAAFILGAVFALVLLGLRRANAKTQLAFGPWMLIGAAVGASLGPTTLATA